MKGMILGSFSLYLLTTLSFFAQNIPPTVVAVRSAAAPTYPLIAAPRTFPVDVEIDVALDMDGDVVNAKFVSGNPLLHKAALKPRNAGSSQNRTRPTRYG